MRSGSFIFINPNHEDDSKNNPFIAEYLRQLDHRQLLSELAKELTLSQKIYNTDVEITIDGEVKLK